MSTRANIIIEEPWSYTDREKKTVSGVTKLYFYRHSDGYPEGAMPTLVKFITWLREGLIRNNIQQGSGWLILLGAMDYNTIPEFKTTDPVFEGGKRYGDVSSIQPPNDWKCGSIEPANEIHGDVEYVYTINLETLNITCQEKQEWGKPYPKGWRKITVENIAGYKRI